MVMQHNQLKKKQIKVAKIFQTRNRHKLLRQLAAFGAPVHILR